MMALPIPWIGVIAWPSTSALRIVAVSGSRFMISAVRNGPTRSVETKTNKIAAVDDRLMATRQAQPRLVCGAFHVRARADMARKTAVDDSIEYQVVRRASAPTR